MESGLVGGECEGCVIEKLRINVHLRTVRSVILIVPSVIVLVYNKL